MDRDATLLAVVDPVAAQRGIAAVPDLHAGESVGEDVVIFQRPHAIVIDTDATLLAVVDPVAAQRGIAAGPDKYAGESVGEDVVIFQRPQAIVIDRDATLLAVMDMLRRSEGLPPFLIDTPARALAKMSLSSSVPRPLS